MPAVRVEVTIQADGAGVRAAADFAERFAAAHGLDADERARLLLLVEELMTNLAKYGYPDTMPRGGATIALRIEHDRLTLEMVDDGVAFNPLAAEAPDLDLPPEARPVGGLGLHLVRSLAEQVHYARTGDRNHLTLVCRIG